MNKKLARRTRRPVARARAGSVFPDLGSSSPISDSLFIGLKKLEDVFDERVASALHRLGIPSAKDVERLQRQMEELTAEVQSLRGAHRRK